MPSTLHLVSTYAIEIPVRGSRHGDIVPEVTSPESSLKKKKKKRPGPHKQSTVKYICDATQLTDGLTVGRLQQRVLARRTGRQQTDAFARHAVACLLLKDGESREAALLATSLG